MPKMKFSKELKSQVLADYEKTNDVKAVSAKYGVTPKCIWQWKSVQIQKSGNLIKINYGLDWKSIIDLCFHDVFFGVNSEKILTFSECNGIP